jgi:hypothetical protein
MWTWERPPGEKISREMKDELFFTFMSGGEVNCNDETIKQNMTLMSTLMIVKRLW